MYSIIRLTDGDHFWEPFDTIEEATEFILKMDDQDAPYGVYDEIGEYQCLVFMKQIWN